MEAVFPPDGNILSRLWKQTNQTLFASHLDFNWIANRLYLDCKQTLLANHSYLGSKAAYQSQKTQKLDIVTL